MVRRLGQPWVVLAPLVVAQWIAVAIFTRTIERNGWLFYQGGDQTWFYTSGWVVAHGHVPETFVGWVWALAMVPVAAIAGPSFLDGVPAVVLFQYLFLLPLGLVCVYAIAARIGGRLLGYWAAAWWIVVPYAVIPLFVDRYHPTFVDQTLPQGLGLTGLGDFPSMIAVLASAYFVVRALETGAPVDAVTAGLLAGLAFGIKPANGLFAFAPLAAFALARRWRRGVEFGLALVPGLLVLALWKHRGSGITLLAAEPLRLAAAAEVPDYSPPTFWERVRDYVPLDLDQVNYQFLGFREFFWSARLLEWVPVAGAIGLARRSVPAAAFFAVWLAAFFVVKGSSPAVNVETGSIWRLLMPAWPAYFLLGVSLPLLVPQWGSRLADRFRSSVRPLPGGPRAVAAAGAACFLLPVVAFVALPPDDTREATKVPMRSLFLPIDGSFQPRGAQTEAGVLRLTWPPIRGYADGFYVVLRSPRRFVFPATTDVVVEGQRCRTPGGAFRCTLEMEEIGRTRARFWREVPPRGTWTYRVGIAANWLDDPDFGDIFVVSAPLNVVVR
jgi:hypothetical protein